MLRASMSVRVSRNVTEEEGGWEYVSDHQGSGNSAHEPRIEPAVLYQPLGEAASGELGERDQSENGGRVHNVSGDGCGDGGYCGGHWVKRSEKGHRHGERIDNVGDPTPVSSCTMVAGGLVESGIGAWGGVAVGFGCGIAALASWG
jgi:hypothetical protein